jgi:hypothetical protein
MRLLERCPWRTCRWMAIVMAVGVAAGCKSDLNQQLLERELRYQEDQIYQLQDELQEKCARLDSVASENTSLRRQLGVGDTDPVSRTRPARPTPATPAAPIAVPPAIQIPDAGRGPAGPPPGAPAAIPGGLAPPALDNIPPLPVKPSSVTEPAPLSLPAPLDAAAKPASVPVAVPVAYDQPLSDGRPVRLVVNAATTACFDDNGDGRSDGINVTFEPRDAAEKLVPAPGAVSIAVFETADPSAPIATWTIPAEQADAHFRRTTRLRGMHFPLRWTGVPPAGDHVRVVVRLTAADGATLETDATVPAR